MTTVRARRLALSIAAVLVGCLSTMTAPAVADPAVGPRVDRSTTIAASSRASTGRVVTKVALRYRGAAKKPVSTKSANIPGIGDVDIFCRSKATMIRLYSPNRQYETQMWTQKYEQKGYDSVAVKNARIYRYAHADDDGKGGTGYYAAEGFNQQTPPETFSRGYLNGVISQRSSRSPSFTAGQIASPRPVTTFELTWYWENMRQPARFRTCNVDAVFTTELDAGRRMGITWHGNDQAAGRDTSTTTYPGLGNLALTCETGADGEHSLTVTPTSADATLYVETVTGEGRVDDHVASKTLEVDADSGSFLPLALPDNGTMRFKLTNTPTASKWFMLSSYVVTNDRFGPERNLCEVSMGGYAATFD